MIDEERETIFKEKQNTCKIKCHVEWTNLQITKKNTNHNVLTCFDCDRCLNCVRAAYI